tara:strand:- start:228 stop:569 length:342 start_codon:yes stop_codon:yes gene_type:complete
MFRELIHDLSSFLNKSNVNYYYEAFVHIMGIVIAAHVAAKAHPIKDHPWNMWYCIILFNVIYIITIALDYDKLDHSMAQLANPLNDVENNSTNYNNLLIIIGICFIAYALYRR